jgi:DNA-binding CsgD family transcriptional regulator
MTTVTTGDGWELLERERPLARVRRRLEAAAGGDGSVVVIEGPAGIGKTSLLRAAAADAAALGMQVLHARGDEVLADGPFAAVRELLWPHRGAAHGSPAAAVFDDAAAAPADLDRDAAILHGLYWTVADLAEDRPALAIVDDAHWLDGASLRFLSYLASRIGSLAVVVVAARRPAEGSGWTAGDAPLDPDPLGASVSEWVTLAPLSRAACDLIVRDRLGPRADDELCAHCHWATAGNPFYLGALLGDIEAIGGRPTTTTARAITDAGSESIARSVRHRLAALGDDCELLASAVAVLSSGTPLRVAGTLAELDLTRAAAAADRMRSAGVLSDDEDPAFAHPLVRAAVAEALPLFRRRALHRRAARTLLDETADPEAVAAHLLAAEPLGEQWAIDALRAAAATSIGRGAPETAVVYLRRALTEPPTPGQRLQLLRELGRAEIVLPQALDSPALREALELAPGPAQRAEVTLELAAGTVGRGITHGLFELAEQTLDEADALDPNVVKALEAILIGAAAPDLHCTRRVLARTRMHFDAARAGGYGDEPWLAPSIAQTGPVLGLLPASEASRLARAVVDADRSLQLPITYVGACGALYWSDDLERAEQALDRGIAEAQRRGSPAMFMLLSVFGSAVALQRGELDAAEAHALRGHELFLELAPGSRGNMFLAQVLTIRGRPQAALDVIASVTPEAIEIHNWQDAIALAERGRARVWLGQLRPGIDDLLAADARMRDGGCQLSVLCDWAPTAIAALARVGELETAETIAQRELAQAESFGAARRLSAARAALGGLRPGADGERLLRDAVALVRDSPARLQHATSLLALGSWLISRGRLADAREPLAQALALGDRCGATTVATAALQQLRAAGVRPRHESPDGLESLTASELRTARMAADGHSNRTIAQRLFVSTKTVETQLSATYRKLAIAGRRELMGALAPAGTGRDR